MSQTTEETTKQLKLEFALASFKVLRYTYAEPPPQLEKSKNGHFEFETTLSADKAQNKISIKLAVVLKISKESDSYEACQIETESTFKIRKFSQLFKDDSVKLPKDFLITLASIHYSTTRGALITKGAGSIIDRFVMPVVNPKDLMRGGETIMNNPAENAGSE